MPNATQQRRNINRINDLVYICMFEYSRGLALMFHSLAMFHSRPGGGPWPRPALELGDVSRNFLFFADGPSPAHTPNLNVFPYTLDVIGRKVHFPTYDFLN